MGAGLAVHLGFPFQESWEMWDPREKEVRLVMHISSLSLSLWPGNRKAYRTPSNENIGPPVTIMGFCFETLGEANAIMG